MVEPKVSLSLLVQGATMLSSQECDKNPKDSYDENKLILRVSEGKGKHRREVNKTYTFKTRKNRLVTQTINMSDEAYQYMLATPTSPKFARLIKQGKVMKTVWSTMSEDERLKKHFDLIANDFHAVSYTYEVLE